MIPEEYLERVELRPQNDPRLGRQLVHDRRSRGYVGRRATGPLRTLMHRVYDPRVNPNQVVGNCTGVSEAIQANAAGNRVTGVVLRMPDADRFYYRATELDPFPGTAPAEDTGSSGLAAATAAVELGVAERFEWYFGLDHVLAGLQLRTISVGTWWRHNMWEKDPRTGVIPRPAGAYDGGHQWTLRGYDARRGLVTGRCWWGTWRDFLIQAEHLGELLDDGGDAHATHRKKVT